MPNFGKRSKKRLYTCHPYLQLIMNKVIQTYDCTIICGYRELEAQEQAFNDRKSQIKWPYSKHNKCYDDVVKKYEFDNFPEIPYSLAVDVGPWPLVWPDKKTKPKTYIKDVAKFYNLAGYILAIAEQMNIKLINGGDWDRDFDILDQSFDDLVHYELDESMFN